MLTTSSTLVNDSATLLYSGSSKRVEMLFAYLKRILRSGGLRLCGQASSTHTAAANWRLDVTASLREKRPRRTIASAPSHRPFQQNLAMSGLGVLELPARRD